MKNFDIFFNSKAGKVERLRYQLNETEQVNKFLKVWKLADDSFSEQRLNWFGKTESLGSAKRKLDSLNDTIKKLNDTGNVKISEKLLVNHIELDSSQLWKLNELHEIFELWTLETSTSTSNIDHRDIIGEQIDGFEHNGESDEYMISLFEHINWYVHELEWYLSGSLDDPNYKDYFYVVRNSWSRLVGEEWVPNSDELTDDDYNQMERVNMFGKIYLDFATVGKDMSHAFRTQDKTLIERKNITQQKFFRPSVNIKFVNSDYVEPPSDFDGINFIAPNDFTERDYKVYYDWCEKNGASKCGYDYKSPSYNLGRISLGETTDLTLDNFGDFFDEFDSVHHVEVPNFSSPKKYISISDKGSH
tara:strand:- start:7725 stop:8804 length:1080 start_codon:yes stop_codon:yes gene_type:complete